MLDLIKVPPAPNYPSILFTTLIVLALVLIVAGVLILVMKKTFKSQMSVHIRNLESLIKSSKDGSRVVLESNKIKNYYKILLILFIKEYNYCIENNLTIKLRELVINDLVTSWVDSKTSTLTLNNSQMTAKLIPLIEVDFEHLIKGELWKGRYTYGDDHAFQFDNIDSTKIYLSNNDFLRDIIAALRNFDRGHKSFFK